MATTIVTDRDSADLLDIYAYLNAKAGAITAAKYDTLFENHFRYLADIIDGGPRRPRLGRGIRIGVVWPYVVIFRPRRRDDIVEILREIGRAHV